MGDDNKMTWEKFKAFLNNPDVALQAIKSNIPSPEESKEKMAYVQAGFGQPAGHIPSQEEIQANLDGINKAEVMGTMTSGLRNIFGEAPVMQEALASKMYPKTHYNAERAVQYQHEVQNYKNPQPGIKIDPAAKESLDARRAMEDYIDKVKAESEDDDRLEALVNSRKNTGESTDPATED